MVEDEEDLLELVMDVIIVEDVFSESKASVREERGLAINRAETGGKDPDRERERRSVF